MGTSGGSIERAGRSRRSLPPRSAKRKAHSNSSGGSSAGRSASTAPPKKKSRPVPQHRRPETESSNDEEDDDDDDEDSASNDLAFRWIDRGEVQANGVTEHKMLEFVMDGKTTILVVGDSMLLSSSDEAPPQPPPTKKKASSKRDDSDHDEEEAFVARIERMWEVPMGRKKQLREHRMKIRTKWYFKKQDVQSLSGKCLGPVTRQNLLNSMTNRDLILSNQSDDNDVLTLLAKCTVVTRKPSNNDPLPKPLPPGTFVCRYHIHFENNGSAVLTPYSGENQPWPEADQSVDPSDFVAPAIRTQPKETSSEADKQKETKKPTEAVDKSDKTQQAEKGEQNQAREDEKEPAQPIKEEQPEIEEAKAIESEDAEMRDVEDKGKGDNQLPEEEADDEESENQAEKKIPQEETSLFHPSDPDQLPDTTTAVAPAEETTAVSEGGTNRKTRTKVADSTPTSASEDETGTSDEVSSESYVNTTSARDERPSEGSNTKGRIQVGPEHQVDVGSFSDKLEVASRKPKLVWSAGNSPEESLDRFMQGASEILGKYLKENNLMVEDPYLPLPFERQETLVDKDTVTLSTISTSSSAAEQQNQLTRECKTEALLETFHDASHDVDVALKVVAASPREFLTAWTKTEKEMFNSGCRRYSGSLRMITRGLELSKDFHDVVDYYYRFKIPDQYRRYQDKKREHSVRMMQYVENRRNPDTVILQRRPEDSKKQAKARTDPKLREWSKTTMSDVVGSMDERRVAAKELLLQIRSVLGLAAMARISDAVKDLHPKGAIPELRECAVNVLREQPDLLEKFLDFLPKRYRIMERGPATTRGKRSTGRW